MAPRITPSDAAVGGRVRTRREGLGMSQGALGAAVGITFQQIRKYESGKNRISASRLQQIANVLKVPPSYFFQEPVEGTSGGYNEEKSPLTISKQLMGGAWRGSSRG